MLGEREKARIFVVSYLGGQIGLSPEKRDLPYIRSCEGAFTMAELLREVEDGTIMGERTIDNMLALKVDVIARHGESAWKLPY